MVDLNPNQFRMRTNMKAAPNSQGTLFQGGNPSPATGKPWPRRFSPERRDAVVEATRTPTYLLAGQRGQKPHFEGGGTVSQIERGIQTIARSTVPVEHLRDAKYSWGANRDEDKGDPAGRYTRGIPDHSNSYKRENRVLTFRGFENSQVPIHEIGHHVSNLTGTAHSASQRGEIGDDEETHFTQRGQEEGFAENYAETHYRDHRGRPSGDYLTSAHGWRDSYGMSEDKDPSGTRFWHFERGFRAERQASPTMQREAQRMAAMGTSNPTGIQGQLPLIHKSTSPGEYIDSRGNRGPDKVSLQLADLENPGTPPNPARFAPARRQS